jgi:hypothetical protein
VLVKALARTWRWQKLLDKVCTARSPRSPRRRGSARAYVSRILRLALLAPDLVESILGGWADQRVMLEKLERPLTMRWEEQRACVCIGFDL